MKKILFIVVLSVVVLGMTIGGCTPIVQDESVATEPHTYADVLSEVGNGKYVLADTHGNYGGSRDSVLYGEGAPFNGQYDVENDEYYTRNDFYNMKSTQHRTIYTNFAPYQQTMANTSGIACMVAVLNYWGVEVTANTELELLKKYESINATTLDSRETATGLQKLWAEYGYTANVVKYTAPDSTGRETLVTGFKNWIEPLLDQGKMVFVRGQDDKDNRWKVIIGYDNMGTGVAEGSVLATDDIIIFMDPCDGWDHYQDGYAISAAGRFERWWSDVSYCCESNKYIALVVDPKEPVTIERVDAADDPTQISQAVIPENHIIRNADGSYGGTYNKSKYGSGSAANGVRDQLTRNYHRFIDVFNMTSTDTRTVLTGYRGYSQTMAASCGPSALYTICHYYGFDPEVFNELTIVESYDAVNSKKVYNNGTWAPNLKKALENMGVTGISYGMSHTEYGEKPSFPTYASFVAFVKENIAKGQPIAVSHRPHGGHWEVIIGYDDMGTDYIYDDVIIRGATGGSWDHYQDGYIVYSASLFYRQWNSDFNLKLVQEWLVIDREANLGLVKE